MHDSSTQALADKVTVALNEQIAFDGTCVARAVSDSEVKISVDSLKDDFEEVKAWVGDSNKATIVSTNSELGVHTLTFKKWEKPAGQKIVDELGV